jgi:hypothetical protein
MRRMERDRVARAREWVAVVLRAVAAVGLEVQESGKRFAAPDGRLVVGGLLLGILVGWWVETYSELLHRVCGEVSYLF